MAEIPQTRYARSGDLHIAYQVLGNGPIDVMLVPGWISHLELEWDNPQIVRAFERLSSFCRLIRFDKRGTGLSDRVSGVPSLEERMDDVRAVMDAVGSKRAALLGISEGGPMSILFAATYPERTSALVLYGSFARDAWAPDHPWGITQERQAEVNKNRAATWGEGLGARVMAPDLADDDEFRRWFGRLERGAATPATINALGQMNLEIDVRSVLSAIAVPTLVVHRTGDIVVNVENGRLIARNIPGANLVELPGRNHAPWAVDAGPLLDEIESFLTGVRSARYSTASSPRSYSPTSLARPSGPSRWAIALGRSFSSIIASPCASSSNAIVAARSTRPATASLRASTDRPARSAAAERSSIRRRRLVFRSAPVFTRASAR